MAENKQESIGNRTPSVYTPGEIERSKKETQVQTSKTLGEIERRSRQSKEIFKKEIIGAYKKIVVDSYISTFVANYDDAFDYYSLLDSFSFNIKETKDSIIPSFHFNTNHVLFNKDAKESHVLFNENSIDDFISNDDLIEGRYEEKMLDTQEEQKGAQENNKTSLEIKQKESYFISSKNKERYSVFNRINKLGGYMPPEESAKESQKIAQENWGKQEGKITSNLIKKIKL